MRIGVHTVSSSDEAATYSRHLTDALRRHLTADDCLVTFDGRRISTVVDINKGGAGREQAKPDARFSRILTSCLAGATLERAKKYAREVDVSHAIGGMAPTLRGMPAIPLIPDFGHADLPDARWADRPVPRHDVLAGITRYRWISTVSDFTRTQLIAICGCDPARVVVIPPGVSDIYRVPDQRPGNIALQALGLLARQFFLHVSASDDDGGLSLLLRAYADLPTRVKAWLPMAVVSKRQRCRVVIPDDVQFDVEAGNIRLMTNVPPVLLRSLYRQARLVLFPGQQGGFGLSLAEALVCHAPVAVNGGTSNAEIAGPLAVHVDSFDVWTWRQTLADQVDHGAHCGRMVPTLNRYSTEFSWDQAAGTAMSLYRQVTAEVCEVI